MRLTQFSTPLSSLEAVVIDTETTGLDARTARIVQFGGIPVTGEVVHRDKGFEQFVNPGIPIPPKTSEVHGIRDADVANAPRFAEAIDALETRLGNATLIGHTIAYDLAILHREYQIAGRAWHQPRVLDIRHLARLAQPTLAGYDLDRLCDWLGVKVDGRHTAFGDAVATAEIYVALIPMLRARGIRTLAEADAASRQLAEKEAQISGGMTLPEAATSAGDTEAIRKIDSFPYRHRVRDLMSSPVVFSDATMTAEQAIRSHAGKRISSSLIKLPSGAIGIVTEKDILRVLGEHGATGLQMTMGDIATHPIQTVKDTDFVYRAIGRMSRLGFRHLPVANEDGEIVGMVTAHRLLRQRASAALMLGDEIDSAPDAAALALAWSKLATMAQSLMSESVDALMIAGVISSEIRAMTRRAAELAQARMIAEAAGPPPVAYAVFVLGSGGRGESQLAADQDNGIVYAEGAAGGREDTYFARLATHMNAILDAAGIPFCKGGVMAKNAQWRKSAADWQGTIDRWVRQKNPQDLLNVDIFFDAVAVHGDAAFVDLIWNHGFERAKREPLFQLLLAETARKRAQPFTLFGGFRVDQNGRIDLKATGLMPIFSCARVLAIKHDVRARPSPDRLRGLQVHGVASEEIVEALVDAQTKILATVIGQQLIDIEKGIPPSPKVDVSRLDKVEKANLKQALTAVDEAIGLVSEGRI
jgi:DNA polymerase-3 subunit epsilon/CBS domain-containing protein